MQKKPKKAASAKRKSAVYQVFISHSSADAWIARQMAKEIGALRIGTWLDEKDLAGGDKLTQSVLAGIRTCQETVVLVTPKSLESQWVQYEIGATQARNKRVTPILHYAVPAELKVGADLKMLELNQFEQFLSQLKQRAKLKRKTLLR
jgi:hypothetical protein